MLEIRLVVRSLLRAPIFTTMSILTFALGIGGTTLMFTAVNAAFLRALPYPAEDRLIKLWQTHEGKSGIPASLLNVLDWKAQNRSFSHLAAYNEAVVNISSPTGPERSKIGVVTRDFFAVMGIVPKLGRTFSIEEASGAGPHVAVISESLWNQAYGGASDVLDKSLSVEGVPFTIVGVMPESFGFPGGAVIWIPLERQDRSGRSAHNYQTIGRLKSGISIQQAQIDMARLGANLANAYPAENAGYGIQVVPLREDILGQTGSVLLLLLGAVFFVLIIACVNVVNLLLARSLARHSEVILRLALGANRTALVRPFILEGVLLALAGGAIGLALTVIAGKELLNTPSHAFDPEGLQVDGTVLFFTFMVVLMVGLLCGVVPALRAWRSDLRTVLASSGRNLVGSRHKGMSAMIVVEVAIAFVLLIGAGLLIRSAHLLEKVDPGFETDNIALLSFSMGGLPGSPYDDIDWRAHFFNKLLKRSPLLPGVHTVGLISQVPLAGGSYNGELEIDTRIGESPSRSTEGHYRLIGGEYFETMKIPVLRGRSFSREDIAGAPLSAMVNERLAKIITPNGDALGRRVRIPGMDDVKEWATIVGVVKNVRHLGLSRSPVPEVYFPFEQRPQRTFEMSLVASVTSDQAKMARQLREEVRAISPGLPVEFGTMDSLLAANLEQPRFRARVLATFSALALLLTVAGIFGVLSDVTERRQREVGIRVALGANRFSVRSLIIRGGMTPVLLGIGVGFLVSILLDRGLSRMFNGLLFNVSTNDPLILGITVVALSITALAAVCFPVFHATEVDPLQVLRSE